MERSLRKYDALVGSIFVPTAGRLRKIVGVVICVYTTFCIVALVVKTIFNIQNSNDKKCFLWSVVTGLHPIASSPHHVNNYVTYEHELNMVLS